MANSTRSTLRYSITSKTGCFEHEEQEGLFIRVDSKRLELTDPSTYNPSETDRTTIFAMLAETTNPIARDLYAEIAEGDREMQYSSVWLKKLPNNFPIAEFWPDSS
jgi:hypothetical protein